MKYVRWVAAIVSAGLLFSSCAPRGVELALDTNATDARTLVVLSQRHQDKLRTLVGRGTVTFESPELSGTAAFELALKKPDSLLVTFEGPFGIDLGTLFISSGKFLVYNSMENRVVSGVPGTAEIRSLIPFDLTLDQIVGAFSGSFPFPSDLQTLRSYSIDDDMFLLSFASGTTTYRYWVDNHSVQLKKYEMRDEHDELIMDAISSSFANDDDCSAPKRIRIRFPVQGRQLSVNYSTITLNDAHPSFAFSIPSNARTTIR